MDFFLKRDNKTYVFYAVRYYENVCKDIFLGNGSGSLAESEEIE